MGDTPQGVAADCNSAEATHAWFDSRVAHQYSQTAPQQNVYIESFDASLRGQSAGAVGLYESVEFQDMPHPEGLPEDVRRFIYFMQRPLV